MRRVINRRGNNEVYVTGRVAIIEGNACYISLLITKRGKDRDRTGYIYRRHGW